MNILSLGAGGVAALGVYKGREQWRVVLELLRMLRTFTPEQRKMLMVHGLFIERNKHEL